jgi:hypothetical protein
MQEDAAGDLSLLALKDLYIIYSSLLVLLVLLDLYNARLNIPNLYHIDATPVGFIAILSSLFMVC